MEVENAAQHIPVFLDDGALLQQGHLQRGARTAQVDQRTRNGMAGAIPYAVGGVGNPAGPTRSDDFESLAYDPTGEVLYEFSGNCCGVAPLNGLCPVTIS